MNGERWMNGKRSGDRCPQGCWEILGHCHLQGYGEVVPGSGRLVDERLGYLGQGRQLTSESLPELGAGGGFQEDLGR